MLHLLMLEIHMLLRNRAAKNAVFQLVLSILLGTAILILMPDSESLEIYHIFSIPLISGGSISLLIGFFIGSWSDSFLPGILTRCVNLGDYIRVKVILQFAFFVFHAIILIIMFNSLSYRINIMAWLTFFFYLGAGTILSVWGSLNNYLQTHVNASFIQISQHHGVNVWSRLFRILYCYYPLIVIFIFYESYSKPLENILFYLVLCGPSLISLLLPFWLKHFAKLLYKRRIVIYNEKQLNLQ